MPELELAAAFVVFALTTWSCSALMSEIAGGGAATAAAGGGAAAAAAAAEQPQEPAAGPQPGQEKFAITGGKRKRELADLERRVAAGETLSKNARKKLLKLKYREEVLPGRKAQQKEQRTERRKEQKAGRRAEAAASSLGEPGPAAAGGFDPLAGAVAMPGPRVAPKTGFAFFEAIGRPRLIAAPMVNQSELPFRLLMKKYGAQLCYTPMIDSKSFANSAAYRASSFSTCDADRPLVAQFAGDDPATVLKAALLVQHQCDAIDLNFGCPQGIARRGHYGAFLLDEPDLICEIVKVLHEGLSVPVTCKVRMVPDRAATIALCKRLEAAGCSLLTVHGRTRDQKGQLTGDVDWSIIKEVKDAVSIPVIANGGIETAADVVRCLEATGADGVMSSEAILACPDVYAPLRVDGTTGEVSLAEGSSETEAHAAGTVPPVPPMSQQCALAQEYLDLSREYPPSPSATMAGGTRGNDTRSNGIVKAHLFKLCYTGLQANEDLRDRLQFAQTFDEHSEVVAELSKRCAAAEGEEAAAAAAVAVEEGKPEPYSWYRRHRRMEDAASKMASRGRAPGSDEAPSAAQRRRKQRQAAAEATT